ncbi:beta-ketoacyl-ACP synthase II [Acholeplasma hippikon]|uniref:3-oxoacyl-[acyl-carrier-protein] synthase 2 n=1 Tax=Acholeplasma hippikon TaxID=264636 RepID=A0A449BI80_9MOLU|nr:beta-ketoacyl-ACP synthase II [Acholeplasma hippikon]VEU82164.1 3-oxoacyl-[acyl-carrier-protein] synthase 2 [Acholeplasma hippikon]
MKRRVVITGLGALTPVGNNVEDTFNNLINGVNGIDTITHFDTKNVKVKLAGELKNLDLETYFDKRDIRRSDRVMLLGTAAAQQAYDHAKLKSDDYDPYRFGIFVTSGIGGLGTLEQDITTTATKGIDRISPFFIPNSIVNMVGGMISIRFGVKGPNIPVVTACSAATNGIGEAFRYIRDGYLDLAFAGGAEAAINEVGIGGFSAIRALSTEPNKDKASRPFDLNRSGFVMGEGAGVLILEDYEHAIKRGAKIYGEIVGYGSTSDAFHMTAPDDEAKGITKAIELAILDAKIHPSDIGYINAHGTSTLLNDKIETLGIKNAFKDHAKKLNISSTKGATGHMLGATGAVESIVCLKALATSLIPPTIHYETPDPECDLNYTPNQSVKRNLDYAMNINIGFGGQNAVVIFKKVGE